jgi:hypothetical protein
MSTEAIDRITDLALAQFMIVLCTNRDYQWGANRGLPPSRGYVERKRFSTEPWTSESAIGAWMIEDYERTTKIEPLIRLPKTVIDGMFYDWLIGSWGVTDDLKQLAINWQTGPLFGRGFVYPILEAPTGVLYLGNGQTTWIS